MSVFNEYMVKKEGFSLDSLIRNLKTAEASAPLSSPNVTRLALAGESLSSRDSDVVRAEYGRLNTTVENIINSICKEAYDGKMIFTTAQKNAATIAGMIAGDPAAFMKAPVFNERKSSVTNNRIVSVYTPTNVDDGGYSRAYSAEAYDNSNNRNANVYSIAYNMQASRQDEFGETFFPTITVAPDEVGLAITVRLMMVFNNFFRNPNGELNDYDKINIIRALTDWKILRNELTRIYPVYTSASSGLFVDSQTIAPTTVNVENVSIQTAPLAVGKKFSLLGISQTEQLLQAGMMDVTDSIEPAMDLENVYIQFTSTVNGTTYTDVIKFSTKELPYSNFVYNPQQNYRIMVLNFRTSSMLMNQNITTVDGSAPTNPFLQTLISSGYALRMDCEVSGNCNIELGDTVVYGNSVSLNSLVDANGNPVDLTSGVGQQIMEGINSGEIIGYDLFAWRSNLNRRQRGQLFDITYFTQIYNIPMRAPITAVRPVNSDGGTDTTDLGALITATRIRTSNYAVTALLQAAEVLSNYVDVRGLSGSYSTNNWPEVLGVGRYLVQPYFASYDLDMAQSVDSVMSSDRIDDLVATIINRIRDFAYRAYQDSEYIAAALVMSGGAVPPPPTVIIGTDPVLSRYLQINGELRTLGNDFACRVVSSIDIRVRGKIFVTFGVFDGDINSAPNPLHFGCMGWKPELTLTIPISRNGQVSKELTVQPSFLHIVNLPILIVINVINLPDVLNKVSIDFNTTNAFTSSPTQSGFVVPSDYYTGSMGAQ
jgi:hypothetical protein